ncbi:conjugal transfer protein TrbA [Salmonella enterica subsp. enterica serovar Legon]|nr:conjugal transfer protein TrbA [Salmonella enterica subsp. enterica serovar Legon]EDW9825504.1 conjugal transfer protein TrbA [Salmonella enterica]EDZ3589496.1 conjugal transfer protein TrbA [Salmonella enterica subsp. enterica serovar Wagenia]
MSSAQSGYSNGPDTGAMLALAGGLALFLGWMFLPECIFISCFILHFLWGLVDFGPLHQWAAPHYNLLATTGNKAATVKFGEWVNVMEQTVGILTIFFVPLVAGTLWSWYMHPAHNRHTRRIMNINTLPHEMLSISPALTPVLNEGDPSRLFLDKRSSSRQVALSPEAFVERHNLIRNMQFDTVACREVFTQQLGAPLSGWGNMAPHEKALFAIFGLQFFLNDRKAATKLLDDLNLSCRIKSRRDHGRRSIPVFSLATPAFRKVSNHKDARKWLKQHYCVRSGLVWLYAHDLRLTPPNWLWLKGIDRTLWYALHRANTDKVFVEGAGVVAVARAESEAIRLNLPCPKPSIETAVEGLRQDMVNLGLIWDDPQPETGRRRSRIQTNWSLNDDALEDVQLTTDESF